MQPGPVVTVPDSFPPARRRSRRPFHPSRHVDPAYRLPPTVADRLAAALQGRRTAERAYRLANYLARHWSAPATLLEAFAKLSVERDVSLVLVTRPEPGGRTEQLIDQLGIADRVEFVNGVSDEELVRVMGSAEVACVPSLYEGFSLPTAELMACATPLVVSRAGAIPEVVGPDGLCADLVTPGDVAELTAAIAALLDDPERRTTMGAAGRARVQELFSWRAVAAATAAAYEETIAAFHSEPGRRDQEESDRADR